ncbi:MAG TPA: hypothetical protein VJS42_18025, partial [Steroidobacteraceae bacterium]|nr:hypothetical protein [Steroidobacteraceae bacterium]
MGARLVHALAGHRVSVCRELRQSTDVLPTTLDVLGIQAPEQIRGIEQDDTEGISLAYSINDAKAEPRHKVQYYYIFGSRAIYADGWKAALPYPTPLAGIKTEGGKP